ncbi:hypothetical protein DOM21_12550 [Bacteriovorax stolpii]|uniref:Uncharacterized protein n=1 Tax=Bacteriovorax stolpii TaxID=960 RepID=A0A2K9NQG7_BACTC|nr:hypothetical protein [Bacteriovorax stolpii]AUN97759.1 hypothetical protein C0V70_06460 [Bacteriovorax stolpii]QDK42256.1 hypothetical protein DOM21_12550 [Bacteriovorax stolpii]TDP51579.1 hypothetical protein C8D79_3023 [Bacteriovorax stolpii]
MKILLFFSVFSLQVEASELTKQIWSQGDDHYLMSYQPSSGILISENCFNDDVLLDKSKCEAAQILKKKKFFKAPLRSSTGGKNPGAVVCKDVLKQKVVMLKDQKNNENSFCRFEDGSMIVAIYLGSLLKD